MPIISYDFKKIQGADLEKSSQIFHFSPKILLGVHFGHKNFL